MQFFTYVGIVVSVLFVLFICFFLFVVLNGVLSGWIQKYTNYCFLKNIGGEDVFFKLMNRGKVLRAFEMENEDCDKIYKKYIKSWFSYSPLKLSDFNFNSLLSELTNGKKLKSGYFFNLEKNLLIDFNTVVEEDKDSILVFELLYFPEGRLIAKIKNENGKVSLKPTEWFQKYPQELQETILEALTGLVTTKIVK